MILQYFYILKNNEQFGNINQRFIHKYVYFKNHKS